MFISKAYAQAEDLTTSMLSSDIVNEAPIDAPSAGEAFMMNMGLIAVLVLMFYILMIRPQKKRIKEHGEMLSTLKKGTKIVTQGGVIGTVDKILNDHEMTIKVEGSTLVILRSAVMSTYAEAIPQTAKVANDDKPKKDKKTPSKTSSKKSSSDKPEKTVK